MATTLTDRIVGHQLFVQAGTDPAAPLTKWKDFEISFQEKTDDANSSDSYLDEEVPIRKWIDGRVTGFLGAVNNGATLPHPGDIIHLSASVGGQSVIPDLTPYGPISVKAPVKYNFAAGPATFEFGFRSGRLGGNL